MTEIDVRLKYKTETGYAPTYGISYEQKSCNYQGALKHAYAEWLENYIAENISTMSISWQRDNFFKDKRFLATYYDKDRNLRYYREYKLWMEELLCYVCTLLHKNELN
jgi:hypothetical protein